MKAGRVSAAAAADMLGVSGPTFAKLIVEGAFERQPPKAGYVLREVVRGTVAHYMRRAAGRAGEDGGMLLAAERAKLAQQQTVAAQMKNAVMSGKFVPVDAMQRIWEDALIVFRERSLTVPGKTADRLQPHTPKDRGEIEDVLRDEIYEMLTDLSDPGFHGSKRGTVALDTAIARTRT